MSWESSSRRRSAQRSSSSRLRMDSYSSSNRSNRNRASPPKRRELDKVMKKARRDGPTQSSYWNKKLLEAEEKDPNRWRHSGYKELYGGGTSSPHGSRSSYKRSQSRSRSHSRSRSRTPRGSRRGGRNSRVRSPLPVTRARSRDRDRRPHTPQPVSQKVTASSSSVQRRSSVKRSPNTAVSVSASSRSLSSCSDESCSVCSPKGRRKPPIPRVLSPRSRSRSFSVPRSRPTNRSPIPKRLGRERSGPPVDPRGPPPSPPPIVRKTLKKRKEERAKANNAKKRKSGTKDRVKRRRSSVVPAPGTMNARGNSSSPLTSTKVSRTRRGVSPAASGCSDDSSVATSGSSTPAEPPRLTLSERFGKMAQWSVDRRDLDGVRNMRITKDAAGDDLKVVIEGERYRSSNAPLSPGEQFFMPSDAAPSSLADLAWDDVRVRYKYYKERGYLRDLTLDDYIKWEEWWYKYQEWLEAERYYEHWAAIRAEQSSRGSKWGGGSSGSSVRKRRRV